MNIECRSNVFCLFYKKRLSEANPPFDIRHSTFCGSAVLRFAFNVVSYKVSGVRELRHYILTPETFSIVSYKEYLYGRGHH